MDLNFAGVPKFTLGSDGGRPVFVPVSSIVASTQYFRGSLTIMTIEYTAISLGISRAFS